MHVKPNVRNEMNVPVDLEESLLPVFESRNLWEKEGEEEGEAVPTLEKGRPSERRSCNCGRDILADIQQFDVI